MSSGIDKQFVRDYYQTLTDQEVLRIFTQGIRGLTSEAQEIVIEELKRRNLDVDVSKIVGTEQETEAVSRAYDPNGCPIDEPTRIWMSGLLMKHSGLDEPENMVAVLAQAKIIVDDQINNHTGTNPERRLDIFWTKRF